MTGTDGDQPDGFGTSDGPRRGSSRGSELTISKSSPFCIPAVAGEAAHCKAINPGEEGYGLLHAFLGLRRVASLAAFLV